MMPDDARGTEPLVHEVGNGTLRIWSVPPNVVVLRIEGHGEGAFARHVNAVMDRMRANATGLEVFFEVSRMPTYDSELRTALTDRFLPMRKEIRTVRILSTSKIVLMGASVANMLLGGLVEVFGDEGKFAAALDRAVAGSPVRFSSASLFAKRGAGAGS